MTIEVEGDVDERAEERIRRLRDVVSCTSLAPVGDERDKGCAPVEVPDLSGIDAHVSAAALSSFVDEAERSAKPLSSVILAQQAEVGDDSAQAILEQMGERLEVMSEAVERGCAEGLRSTSGFTGGDARRMRDAVREGGCVTGGLVGNVAYRALAVSELNASMGRIVAAPTAGSCGIIPAVILTLRDELGCSRDACVRGLVTAGGIGMLIQRNATLAGAEGGCQAETGAAAAMAAAAMVELLGGSAQASSDAASMAIQALLGLVCDPVAGLVEVPCVNRNATGAMVAVTCAEMALAGIPAKISFDDAVEAMRRVGSTLPPSLRETGEGGLAVTASGMSMAREFRSGCSSCGMCG